MMTFTHGAMRSAAIIVALTIGATPGMSQDPKLVAGTLTCKGTGSVGMILGSKQTLSCAFNPAGRTPPHSYAATITKIGLDVGIRGPSTMLWTVLSSTTDLPAGALAGNYAGASADVSVAIGGGANVLVGGSKNSVVLQPLSVQGQAGLNIAAGVAELSLRPN
jgi:hypothetical protein